MLRRSGTHQFVARGAAWSLTACALAFASTVGATPFFMPPPLGQQPSLAELGHRPAGGSRRFDIPLAAAPAATAPTAAAKGSGAVASPGRPFDARITGARTHARPDAASALRSEAARLPARVEALRHATPEQRADLGRLGSSNFEAYLELLGTSPDLAIAWDGDQAIFVTGRNLASAPSDKAGASGAAIAAATAFWEVAAPLFGLAAPGDELRLTGRDTDALGQTHLRYAQIFGGIPVWAREAVVHVEDGRVVCANGRLSPTPTIELEPSISSRTAVDVAVGIEPGARPGNPELVVYVPADGSTAVPRLAWRIPTTTGLDRAADYFIDATDGSLLHRSSRVATDGPVAGSGVDLLGQTRSLALYQVGTTYYNINTTKPMFDAGGSNIPQTVKGGIRIFDAQHGQGQQLFFSLSSNPTNWTGKATDVSAAANGDVVFEYFSQRHARNSIDGRGGTLELVVNFQNNFNNAFWNGQFMVFGNGDGNQLSDLASALDVTAHEMSHGVIEHTANLVYETQSGALNESFADVFGVSAEWFARPTTANWLIGEEVTTPTIAGDCMRNMQDPAAANVAFGGQQPTRMSQYQNLPNNEQNDNGGVHVNSGIPNRAYYLAATDPALGATDTERIGNAERIWYRALGTYLTRTSQFIDCRLGVVRAAEDLFGGPDNAVALACASAFDLVEIVDGQPTGPPPTLPPVQGAEYIGVTDAGNGWLVRATPDFAEIVPLSSVAISNKPTYTDDGEFVLFVDVDSRLRVVRSDGTGEAFLSTVPVWRSIAVSPDGKTLAATSLAFDDTLYLLDLSGTGTDRAWPVRTASYGGETDLAAQFADFLDFSNDGSYVLYDAFNLKVQSTGDTLAYWDINVLRAADGDVQRVFPPQPPGIDIGNPTFSPLSDFVIAFDFVDEAGNVSVLGADLENGSVGLVTNNFGSLGRPSFSPDAQKVVYQYIDSQGASIWTVTLAGDGVTGTGDDLLVANGGFDPVWFAVGTRTAVALTSLTATVGHDGHARVIWEAAADAEHDHFRVLRDAGSGWEVRGGAVREPAARGRGADRWEFRDALDDVPTGTDVVRYGIQSVDRSGAVQLLGRVELRLDAATLPRVVQLFPNVPNPFNPETALRFALGRRQQVRLDVLDAAGRRVRLLALGPLDAGTHVRTWDGRDDTGAAVASGVYLVRLATTDGTESRKIVLAK